MLGKRLSEKMTEQAIYLSICLSIHPSIHRETKPLKNQLTSHGYYPIRLRLEDLHSPPPPPLSLSFSSSSGIIYVHTYIYTHLPSSIGYRLPSHCLLSVNPLFASSLFAIISARSEQGWMSSTPLDAMS